VLVVTKQNGKHPRKNLGAGSENFRKRNERGEETPTNERGRQITEVKPRRDRRMDILQKTRQIEKKKKG